jgi:hypothetical protein
MEKVSSGQRPVEANSTGGQGSRRAVAPSDDDDKRLITMSIRAHHKFLF